MKVRVEIELESMDQLVELLPAVDGWEARLVCKDEQIGKHGAIWLKMPQPPTEDNLRTYVSNLARGITAALAGAARKTVE